MKKKFVMAAAAVAMAAVMSVSAFAADGVAVASITGNDSTSVVAPSSASVSTETKTAYETFVTTEGSAEEKLAAALESVSDTASAEQAATIIADAAEVVGAESTAEVSIRGFYDVTPAENGNATMTVAGVEEGETVVILYLDANGEWQTMAITAKAGGKLVFPLGKTTTVTVLTKKKA